MTRITHIVRTFGTVSSLQGERHRITLPAIPGVDPDVTREDTAPQARSIRRPPRKCRLDPAEAVRRACMELMREAAE